MFFMQVALAVFAYIIISCSALYWIFQFVSTLHLVTRVAGVGSLRSRKRRSWPLVSVIIPARNEADTIETALQKRCESEYPNLELIVINDRSIDETGAIAERIAKEDSRMRVIHIESLPEAWIGKLYAMHVGAQQARGEWLLFSDADVHVRAGTLDRVIAECEDKHIDHMAILPQLYPTTFFVDVTLAVFMRQICVMGQPWKARDPKSKAAVGSGGFNLVRRTAFDAINGFETMRGTVTDDIALGRVLKHSGARADALNGRDYVRVTFYRTVRDIAVGSERALFAMFGNFSAMKLIVTAVLMFALELAPFAALFAVRVPALHIIGAVLTGGIIATSLVANVYLGLQWWTAFFVWIAIPIMFVCMVRAALLGKKRGGIIWRGTFYPSEQLRKFRQS
jgi:cellulose synthase/poly-beta-1,6-N-acetylglucosamine synthase-like glycosyltransferase